MIMFLRNNYDKKFQKLIHIAIKISAAATQKTNQSEDENIVMKDI